MTDWMVKQKGKRALVAPSGIVFDPQAALDTLLVVRMCATEVLGLLKISVSNDFSVSLSSLFIPRQEVSRRDKHELGYEFMYQCFDELAAAGEDPGSYAVWHSHVKGIAHPSFIDMTTVNEHLLLLLETAKLRNDPSREFLAGPYMELVFNVHGHVNARMDFLYKKEGVEPGDALTTEGSLIHYVVEFPHAQQAFRRAINQFPEDKLSERIEAMERVVQERVIVVPEKDDEDDKWR